LTFAERAASVTCPASIVPAGNTSWPRTETACRSAADTRSSTWLLSDPTAVLKSMGSDVPAGSVTSRKGGSAGAPLSADASGAVADVVAGRVSAGTAAGSVADDSAGAPGALGGGASATGGAAAGAAGGGGVAAGDGDAAAAESALCCGSRPEE